MADVTDRDREAARAMKQQKWVWDVFWAIIILAGIWMDYGIWRDALQPMRADAIALNVHEDWHVYRVRGVLKKAHHVETTKPDWMGTTGFTATGFNEYGEPIWSASGLTELERIR